MTQLRQRLQHSLGGAYTIERELDGGGIGRSFVAREAALGQEAVVKVLSPELHGWVDAERFRRGILAAAALRHPRLAPVLDAGDLDGLPFYTAPLVAGESLRARLAREGALPVDEAVRLVREIAEALACAHAAGVVHRDLKPENVLLADGHAVVTDLGVAHAFASATETASGAARGAAGGFTAVGMGVGTPAYMAPEQALADPAADHRVDLYALGCIAYEMLAGAPPHVAGTPQAVIERQLTAEPESLRRRRPEVPAPVAALVMRLLEKDPDERPRSAAEVLRLLDAGGGTAASRPRARWLGVALAVVAVAAALAAGWWLLGRA